jgi:hypothetical protein
MIRFIVYSFASIVSIDGTSLYHEARAAGVVYQANAPGSVLAWICGRLLIRSP